MPPPRRARRRCGLRPAAAAETPCPNGKGWLSLRRRQFKREGRADYGDDGLPLSDETLLVIFSGLSDTKDLVRCAATCRRWRRLVSTDAAFICRGAPRSDRFIRRLALDFIHNHDGAAGSSAPPHFVPLASPPRQISLSTLVDDGLLESSGVVASRNGRLVLDLRRTKRSHILRLCVCNPMTGDVDVLPPLRGKENPGPYACTVLTAADELHLFGDDKRCTASSYRVLLVYNHCSFTALRCYSSEDGSWGPEAEVTGARAGRNRLGGKMHSALVHRGMVFWSELAIDVRLSTLQLAAAKNAKLPYTVEGSSLPRRYYTRVDRLLGVTPDGRLCVVEADTETIRAYFVSHFDAGDSGGTIGRSLLGTKKWKWTIKVALIGPERVHTVKLQWFCEKSGVVLFTARNGFTDPNTYVYMVDVETKKIDKVAGGDLLGEIYGYEMDRVALLASLVR